MAWTQKCDIVANHPQQLADISIIVFINSSNVYYIVNMPHLVPKFFFLMLNFGNMMVLIYMLYCGKKMHQIWTTQK